MQSCRKSDSEDIVQVYQVAMLAQGTTFDDMAFLQSCKEGLEKAKNTYNLKVTYNIDTTTNEYFERISNFGEKGFDLVIAIGYMWNQAVLDAADMYSIQELCVRKLSLVIPYYFPAVVFSANLNLHGVFFHKKLFSTLHIILSHLLG